MDEWLECQRQWLYLETIFKYVHTSVHACVHVCVCERDSGCNKTFFEYMRTSLHACLVLRERLKKDCRDKLPDAFWLVRLFLWGFYHAPYSPFPSSYNEVSIHPSTCLPNAKPPPDVSAQGEDYGGLEHTPISKMSALFAWLQEDGSQRRRCTRQAWKGEPC
eukprot:scaffold23684_cov19-Tisochrysis_lutea.AAC.2